MFVYYSFLPFVLSPIIFIMGSWANIFNVILLIFVLFNLHSLKNTDVYFLKSLIRTSLFDCHFTGYSWFLILKWLNLNKKLDTTWDEIYYITVKDFKVVFPNRLKQVYICWFYLATLNTRWIFFLLQKLYLWQYPNLR